MKHFTILGDNHYAISMILESLEAIHGSALDIDIIINRDQSQNETSDQEYKTSTIKVQWLDEKESFNQSEGIYLGGMSPESRKFLLKHFKQRIGLDSLSPLAHPSAQLARSVEMNHGTRIEPLVVIAPFVKIGAAVLINRHASIGHHTRIGDYCNINPGAIVNGNCTLGEGCTIGSGAIINDGVNIGDHSIIGSGSIVTKDIPEKVIAYGSPAKVIKPIS